MAIFFTLYFVKVILFLFVKFCQKVAKGKYGSESLSNWLSKQIFYREILNILFEGYLEFLIAGYLNYKAPLNTLSGEIVG